MWRWISLGAFLFALAMTAECTWEWSVANAMFGDWVEATIPPLSVVIAYFAGKLGRVGHPTNG